MSDLTRVLDEIEQEAEPFLLGLKNSTDSDVVILAENLYEVTVDIHLQAIQILNADTTERQRAVNFCTQIIDAINQRLHTVSAPLKHYVIDVRSRVLEKIPKILNPPPLSPEAEALRQQLLDIANQILRDLGDQD